MTTVYRRHIGDPVRASPRVVAAIDVLIDLNGYDADDAFCELLRVAYRTQLDVCALADALVAMAALPSPDDLAVESWIASEVWGRRLRQRQHRLGKAHPAPFAVPAEG